MARCPFAEWMPISGPSGSFTGGPFKIVHHTTEGHSAQGAFDAYRANRSDPHFTVDATRIVQHIDTSKAARALRNAPGGVQTNRDSAIQIEVVGFAHRPKSAATLRNVQRLCNWIAQTHGVARVWPSGPPKPAVNGRDPGGHNRSVANWDTKSGHYGHSQVPENIHWDPGYTAEEAAFVIAPATMDVDASLLTSIEAEPDLTHEVSRMLDDADPQSIGADAIEAAAHSSRKPPAKSAAARRKTTKAGGGRAKSNSKAKSKVSAAKSKRSARKATKRARKPRKASKTPRKAPSKKTVKTRRKT
jgi:N-acetylmuramoyl-L-alanine amidase